MRNKFTKLISEEISNSNTLENELISFLDNSNYIMMIPSNYRNSFAINTMIKFLSNGQADNWKEASLRFDEQIHRWELEKNSLESLEIQKYTAALNEITAKNSGRIARATSYSAYKDFLRD